MVARTNFIIDAAHSPLHKRGAPTWVRLALWLYYLND